MLMEKFIHLLLIFRPFLKEIPAILFAVIIVILLAIKKFKEGYTIGTAGQILSLLIIFVGDAFEWPKITQWGTFTAVINYRFI